MPSENKVFESPPGRIVDLKVLANLGRAFAGNDGATPTQYIQGWQAASNLTAAQEQWFATNPTFLSFFAKQRRWLAETTPTGALSVTVNPVGGSGPVSIPIMADDLSKTYLIGMRQGIDDGLITSVPFTDAAGMAWTLTPADGKAVHQAVLSFLYQLRVVQGTLLTGIAAATITTTAQIESAIAAVAPNSPSAKTPQVF